MGLVLFFVLFFYLKKKSMYSVGCLIFFVSCVSVDANIMKRLMYVLIHKRFKFKKLYNMWVILSVEGVGQSCNMTFYANGRLGFLFAGVYL